MPGEMNAPCCSQVEKGAQGRIKSGVGNWSSKINFILNHVVALKSEAAAEHSNIAQGFQ